MWGPHRSEGAVSDEAALEAASSFMVLDRRVGLAGHA